MKVLIIGSGLIGVTTAYCLQRRGHEVTVVDRQSGPGEETSFANGALLTPSMAEPWNTPGSWRVLLESLVRSDSVLQLHLRTLPTLVDWGVTFLRQSRRAAFERNVLSNVRLAIYSLETMSALRQDTGVEYGRAARGSLRIFRDPASLDRTVCTADRRLAEGLRFRRLSREETVDLEPALAPIADQLAGGLHYEVDETGDAYRFCVGLADYIRRQGVEFRFCTEVSSLEMGASRVAAVVSGRERFVADRYVIAAGSYSTLLLRRVGVRLPVQPAKGYSVTFHEHERCASLNVPVIDDELHAVIVPLDGAIRVAGTAEFAGYDLTPRPERIRSLLTLLRKVLPQVKLDPAKARPWCGLRAMSADGVPIIGATQIANLFVNSGHGHLGWTTAAGSAHLLAAMMSGDAEPIDAAPYALERFIAAR